MADILISDSAKDNDVAAVTGERTWREPPTWCLFHNKDNIRARQHRLERPLLQRCGDRCLCGKDAAGIERSERDSIRAQDSSRRAG